MPRKYTGSRPYTPRLDGAVGRVKPFPYAGGIFGQPNRPRNHTGIFEAQYAIPDYVEQAELDGGPLFAATLRADSTLAEPIEKGIKVPDLGPPIRAMYPTIGQRQRRQAALGNDEKPGAAAKPGLLQRPVAGPLVLVGVGLFIAYALWGE